MQYSFIDKWGKKHFFHDYDECVRKLHIYQREQEGDKMNVNRLLDTHKALSKAALSIMESKNHDYRGGTNDPFANFNAAPSLGIDPVLGVLLRMQDKIMRIKTYNEKKELKVEGEGIRDAVMDIINYAVIAYCMLEDKNG